MKQSSSIYFNMGGLFYEGKGYFEIIVSGISSVGCLPAPAGLTGIQTGHRERAGYGRNFSDLCAVLPGRRIFGRKDTSSG